MNNMDPVENEDTMDPTRFRTSLICKCNGDLAEGYGPTAWDSRRNAIKVFHQAHGRKATWSEEVLEIAVNQSDGSSHYEACDPFREGIEMAIASVRQFRDEYGMNHRAAILESLRTLDIPEGHPDAWNLQPRGLILGRVIREAVHDHLIVMLSESPATPENPHIGSSLDDLLAEDAK